jgi:PAS domain S-box-containing protein
MQAAKILVVDDDREMRNSVCRALQHAGFQVWTASSREAALKTTADNPPDLVLLDIEMPGLDGIETVRRIKADPRWAHAFVIHLTSQQVSVEQRMRGFEAGADGYIPLPVENVELLSHVAAFLRHKKTIDELRASEARYRVLFEGNPVPMWIHDAATFQILAVNRSAVEHYGFSEDEFLSRSITDFVPAEDRAGLIADLRDASPAQNPVLRRHGLRSGAVIEVEVTEQNLIWNGRPAVAALLSDVTARNQVERERLSLLEKYEREFKSLKSVSRFERNHTQAASSASSIRALGEDFDRLIARYSDLVERALEQRVFKVDHNISTELQQLAEELFQLTAAPRDVVELHCASMKKLVPEPSQPRAQGLLEAGRLVIVELMGYVLSAYRNSFLQKRSVI